MFTVHTHTHTRDGTDGTEYFVSYFYDTIPTYGKNLSTYMKNILVNTICSYVLANII